MVRLKARVRAVPENGKANRAIEKLIAKRLKIAKSTVSVVSGETSRNKTIRIDGETDDLVAAIESLV